MQLPFDNISIGAFYSILVQLKEDDGSIAFNKLKSSLSSNLTFFTELKDRNSQTSRILLSPFFADNDAPKSDELTDFIDFTKLCSLALLYCKFDSSDTPKIFYKVL